MCTVDPAPAAPRIRGVPLEAGEGGSVPVSCGGSGGSGSAQGSMPAARPESGSIVIVRDALVAFAAPSVPVIAIVRSPGVLKQCSTAAPEPKPPSPKSHEVATGGQ